MCGQAFSPAWAALRPESPPGELGEEAPNYMQGEPTMPRGRYARLLQAAARVILLASSQQSQSLAMLMTTPSSDPLVLNDATQVDDQVDIATSARL